MRFERKKNTVGLRMGALLLSVFMLVLSGLAVAAKPGKAAVATAHPLATAAALDVMAQGGNAFDAAIAASAALAVVEPYGSGLGGGGFYLLREAGSGREVMLDARETAPGKATADMYLDARGDFRRQLAIDGPLAAGIPGVPAALGHLAKNYGKLSLSQSLAPAIKLAEQGFEVDARISKMLGFRRAAIEASPAAREVFLNEGELPEPGEVLVQADLAKTLKWIAQHGSEAFYHGEFAKQLVAGVQAAGGIWQEQDLTDYRVIERDPIKAEYRGMQITSAALPSSGGIALAQMLNTLSQLGLDQAGREERVHLLVEVMRRAYRDRAQHMGDPAFAQVPQARLLHPMYAAGLAAGIRRDRATPSELLPGYAEPAGGEDTTHFSILDTEGNAVAATLSINYPFGSGFVVPGTGVLLNDEMDDFASKPGAANVYGLVGGVANRIEPGKRMLSSMTPTFLEHEGRLAIVGTPGGSRIITMVLQAALAFYEGKSAEDIVALPRFHHQFLPDQIQFEPGAFSRNTRFELQLLGHDLKEMGRQYGNMQLVIWDRRKSKLDVASDPRGLGKADLGSYQN